MCLWWGLDYREKGGDVLCLGMEGYGMKWDDGIFKLIQFLFLHLIEHSIVD